MLNARLATSQSGGGSGVPVGMRAVSVHLTDSTGVLALLRSGQKVDVQVVVGRGTKPDETEVRTALENLTVLSVDAAAGAKLAGAESAGGDAAGETRRRRRSGGGRFRRPRAPALCGIRWTTRTRSRGPLSLGSVMRGGAESISPTIASPIRESPMILASFASRSSWSSSCWPRF